MLQVSVIKKIYLKFVFSLSMVSKNFKNTEEININVSKIFPFLLTFCRLLLTNLKVVNSHSLFFIFF